jgi:hypothetical protein
MDDRLCVIVRRRDLELVRYAEFPINILLGMNPAVCHSD